MDQDQTQKQTLANPYVRDYYNAQVGTMESYTQSRWFASKVHEFDYRQTKKTLEKAFNGKRYRQALEIGPGDAVWTQQISAHVDGTLHLVEQSDEMLAQAKKKVGRDKRISFERSDFMDSNPPSNNDVIVSLRCLEYFTEKKAGLEKMFSLLKPGGQLIIVTKNADLYTKKNVQNRTIHSDQLTKEGMRKMLDEVGFEGGAIYSATLRWKAKFALARGLFSVLHNLNLLTGGKFVVPVINKRATESYLYMARRPK